MHPLFANPLFQDPLLLRSSVQQSRVSVTMMYFGKSLHLCHDLTDMRDEVKVFQQHCGGENLCVYKGKLHEGGEPVSLLLDLFRRVFVPHILDFEKSGWI